jgi:hypothetical protein
MLAGGKKVASAPDPTVTELSKSGAKCSTDDGGDRYVGDGRLATAVVMDSSAARGIWAGFTTDN